MEEGVDAGLALEDSVGERVLVRHTVAEGEGLPP